MSRSKNRLIAWLVGLIGLVTLCWIFPPFRVVSLEQARTARQETAFNAAKFAKDFWTNRLLASLDRAADASEALEAQARDPKAAAERFGRRVGMGGSTFFFLRGTGTVVSTDGKGIGVSLPDSDSHADILLSTGLIFGNAVRDATGLLDVSDFPNSQHLNEISTELNRIVEERVIPQLKEEANAGRRVQFVFCAELSEGSGGARPLKVIPVWVNFEKELQ